MASFAAIHNSMTTNNNGQRMGAPGTVPPGHSAGRAPDAAFNNAATAQSAAFQDVQQSWGAPQGESPLPLSTRPGAALHRPTAAQPPSLPRQAVPPYQPTHSFAAQASNRTGTRPTSIGRPLISYNQYMKETRVSGSFRCGATRNIDQVVEAFLKKPTGKHHPKLC